MAQKQEIENLNIRSNAQKAEADNLKEQIRNLTEEKWIKVNKEYERWGKAELFEYNPYVWPHNEDDLGLKRGIVKRGETITFSEDISPYKREYLVTYSTDEFFSSFSTLKAEI